MASKLEAMSRRSTSGVGGELHDPGFVCPQATKSDLTDEVMPEHIDVSGGLRSSVYIRKRTFELVT